MDVKNMCLMRVCGRLTLVMLAVLVAVSDAVAQDAASLDAGWKLMHGLEFRPAERQFRQWEREHPRDPFGPMSVASSLLFEELDRLGVLQVPFFVDDSSFMAQNPNDPDPVLRGLFKAALADAEGQSERVLATDSHDRHALSSLARVYGLRADYVAPIEGRSMAFLSNSRKAASRPHTAVSSVPSPASRSQLPTSARRTALARPLLSGLVDEFPTNTLFAREFRRLEGEGR